MVTVAADSFSESPGAPEVVQVLVHAVVEVHAGEVEDRLMRVMRTVTLKRRGEVELLGAVVKLKRPRLEETGT